MMLRRIGLYLFGLCMVSLLAGRVDAQPSGASKQECVTSFEQAQKLRGERKLVEARDAMITCGQASCPEAVRVKCVEWLPEVERALPSVVIAVRDREGRDAVEGKVWIDGKLVKKKLDGAPIPVNPGPHKVKVSYGDEKPLEQEIVAHEGEKYRKLTFNYHRKAAPAQPAPVPPAWAGPGMVGMPPPAMPPELPYNEGEPVPDGYEVDSRIRKGLVIGGAVTFGTVWLLSVVTAAIVQETREDASEAIPLYIPIGGPFAAIATLDASGAGLGMLIVDGVVQTGGAAMLLAGIFAREEFLRLKYPTGELQIMPQLGPSVAGMGLSASF